MKSIPTRLKFFLTLIGLCIMSIQLFTQSITNFQLVRTSGLKSSRIEVDKIQIGKLLTANPTDFSTALVSRNGQLFQVDLKRAHLGKVRAKNATYYTGKVLGDPQSLVTLKIQDSKIEGMISNHSGNERFVTEDGILVFEYDEVINKQWQCESEVFYNEVFESKHKNLKSVPGDSISIYFECDYEMYLSFGSSVAATIEYVNDLFHQVSAIYLQEGINLVIDDIKVWQSPDPYVKSSTAQALISFKDQVGPFNATFAHLLSTYNNLSGGIALINGLCNSGNSYAYSNLDGDMGQQGVYSWDVHVVAHEIGHNLGSPHTHDCAWGPNGNNAIDGCGGPSPECDDAPIPQVGGTIMSYCHQTNVGVNFSLGFGQEPGDLIRNNIETCLPDQGEICDLATLLTGTGTNQITGINSGAGAFNAPATHARWYSFTPDENGSIDLMSCEQGIDTRIFIYTGTCQDLYLLASSDDDCHSGEGYFYASTINGLAVSKDSTYFIEWDDKWSDQGFNFFFTYIPESYTCNNGIMDGDETGIDCGGSCPPCMEPCSVQELPMIIDSILAHRTMDTLTYQGKVMAQGDLQISASQGIEFNEGLEISQNGSLEIVLGDCDNN